MAKDRRILYNGNPAVFLRDERFTILFGLEDASKQQIAFTCPKDSDLREFLSASFAAYKSTGLYHGMIHMTHERREPQHYGQACLHFFSQSFHV